MEKEVSSQANSENGLEHLELRGKSSSSRRLTRSSDQKLGIGPSDLLPAPKLFLENYARKKKRFSSSVQEIESPEVEAIGASYSRDIGVLTRFSTRNKSRPVESPEVENQSSSEEIHVIESEAEILREAEIITHNVVVKKRRRLFLSYSSSSSSDHSIPTS